MLVRESFQCAAWKITIISCLLPGISCGWSSTYSLGPVRATDCAKCYRPESCLKAGYAGERKFCGIPCGQQAPESKCPDGFFCYSNRLGEEPDTCVPIIAFDSLGELDGAQGLCVLEGDNSIFWSWGIRDIRRTSTQGSGWKITEGCVSEPDSGYRAVCAPGTRPAPVVSLVPCE